MKSSVSSINRAHLSHIIRLWLLKDLYNKSKLTVYESVPPVQTLVPTCSQGSPDQLDLSAVRSAMSNGLPRHSPAHPVHVTARKNCKCGTVPYEA